MFKKALLFSFVSLLVSGAASAADDAWGPAKVSGGGTTSITATATGDTEILETRLCSALVVMTEDANVTFDVEFCRAKDASTCRVANATSPINAATSFGMQVSEPPAYLRLAIASISANPTFTLNCLK